MTSPRKGRPPKIDREKILDAATAVLDEQGYSALTMRAVADRCDVTVMSLYRHVETKADLVALLAARALSELELPPAGSLSWQDEIRTVLHSLHRVLAARPEFAQIVSSEPLDLPTAYRGMELVIGTLIGEGLTDAEAVAAYDALVSFVRGFNIQHAGRRAAARPAAERLAAIQGLDADDFQHVRRIAQRVITPDPDQDFQAELDVVLLGIDAMIQSRRTKEP